MAEKVALPSLSLPKQKTHWSVYVVVAASVLFLIMCGALYMVMQRQQAQEDAFAKRQADHQAELKAEADKARAETERAAAETKRKEAEVAAAAAMAAAQKKAAAAEAAAAAEREAHKKASGGAKKNGKAVAKAGPTPAQGSPAVPPPAPKPQTKASKDIDDLLKSFK